MSYQASFDAPEPPTVFDAEAAQLLLEARSRWYAGKDPAAIARAAEGLSERYGDPTKIRRALDSSLFPILGTRAEVLTEKLARLRQAPRS